MKQPRILQFKRLHEGPTDRPTNRQAWPLVEMRGRIYTNVFCLQNKNNMWITFEDLFKPFVVHQFLKISRSDWLQDDDFLAAKILRIPIIVIAVIQFDEMFDVGFNISRASRRLGSPASSSRQRDRFVVFSMIWTFLWISVGFDFDASRWRSWRDFLARCCRCCR